MKVINKVIQEGKKRISTLLSWRTKGQDDIETPLDQNINFTLKYKDLIIGELVLKNGVWMFLYSESFKEQTDIQPLPDFPNVNKVYENQELYPFFLIRIPSLKQPKVQKVIKEKEVDANNAVELLKTFGYKSIANPFLLITS